MSVVTSIAIEVTISLASACTSAVGRNRPQRLGSRECETTPFRRGGSSDDPLCIAVTDGARALDASFQFWHQLSSRQEKVQRHEQDKRADRVPGRRHPPSLLAGRGLQPNRQLKQRRKFSLPTGAGSGSASAAALH